MTTTEIRELLSRNMFRPALVASAKLEVPDAFRSDFDKNLVSLKADISEYDDHIIMGDWSRQEIAQSRASLVARIDRQLRIYEFEYIKDLKKDFEELAKNIEQAKDDKKDAVVKEARDIASELESIDIAEKKEDVKPSVLKRIGEFIIKFQDKDSIQGKVLQGVKNGVGMLQQIGKKYNGVAQWFALPQIPTPFL